MMGTARQPSRSSFVEWLRRATLKDPDAPPAPAAPTRSLEEARAASRSADDKERLIGLLAAPVAAAIALMTTSALIANDPPALLASGLPNKLHVSVGVYHELLLALLGLTMVMLATAWFRKRLYLGMAIALYGLALFNMHYWGFGIPFLMAGSWLIVRAYRLQREVRAAAGELPGASGYARSARVAGNKRYTPPTERRRTIKG